MTSSPTLPERLRRIDPRLIIGLVLVGASVAGVVSLVAGLDRTVEIVAAREPLAPGDTATLDDLVVVEVRLDAARELYLTPGQVPRAGLTVTRPIAAGELVPASAVGDADRAELAPVVVTVDGILPTSVRPAATVDLWGATPGDDGEPGLPDVIVAGATVVRLVETDSLVAGGEVGGVEVLVPRAELASVLSALAEGAALSLVPTTVAVR